MFNRNAARHLALIVSILICFFVYMGYYFLGKSEAPAEGAQETDISLTPDQGISGLIVDAPTGGGLRPSGSQAGSPGSPLAPPSASSPTPSSPDSEAPDISDLLQQNLGGGISLTPPPDSLQPPAGLGGETSSPAVQAPPIQGDILGLIPDTPANRAPRNAPAESMIPAPPGESAPADTVISPPASVVAPPTSGAGGSATRPPSSLAPQTGMRPTSSETAPSGLSDREPTVGAPQTDSVPTPGRIDAPVARPPAGNTPRPPTREVVPPQPVRTPQSVTPETDGGSESLRIYVVRPGDTLSRIATQELGSITLADNIFLLNRDVIADPDRLTVGARLRLPVREADVGVGAPAPRVNASAGIATPPPGQRERLHVVAPGDTLSSIALRYYGTSTAWRFLHESNAAAIANPNQLKVGTQLVIPPYNGQ